MPGTIIITGANGSLAVPATQLLLAKYPDHTLILTARNPQTINKPNGNHSVHVRKLDLADLSAVHAFATTIISDIQTGKLPPLTSIVCNAFYWNLRSKPESTDDGYEKTFQVNHIAHAALVLRLLGHFDRVSGGRVVLFSSDAHWPGKNGLEKYPPKIPEGDDLETLVKPPAHAEAKSDHMGRGFQRYATSKLAIVMWMYALNRHLEADLALNKITAVAVNPGNLTDSRALRVNTPPLLTIMSLFVIRPFLFLLRRFVDPTMRTSAEAAADIVEFATRSHSNTDSPEDRTVGYYTLGNKDISSPDSLDEAKQEALWAKTLQWARISSEDMALLPA
ncbi:NAD(P)-binding protein [Aspergillus cavernicola]|uniref:3beta-hydroxysteroid 3-dehydrogenase n=1 Tax=Aspergillus cavernicola TaxID=176166 RepID=A0ABR4J625_9EURO